ncbi:MAG: Strongly imilar to aspartate aminotransferase, partial [uncultured bacterium]
LEVSDTIITSGVSGGLTLAILALMDPGDEILVPDPYFVMYPELVKLYGGTPVYIDTYPDFLLTAEKIKKAITPKTKILFLNSPSNPTGRIIPREDLKQIADVLKNTGIWVISDDIYDLFDYENKHSLFGNLYEKTITLGGFSKTAAMTGWRVGFAGGPAEVIDAMIKLQQYTFVCSPSFAQYAAVTAMDVEKEYIKDDYRKKRDLVFNMMKNNFEIVKPDGAFYAFIKHPSINGDDFVQKALDKNVMLIPGSVFSSRNTHFRLSFANTLEKLQTGIQTLLQIK